MHEGKGVAYYVVILIDLFILPLLLTDICAGIQILDRPVFFSPSNLKILYHCLLASVMFVKMSTVTYIVPLKVKTSFSSDCFQGFILYFFSLRVFYYDLCQCRFLFLYPT